MIDRLLILVSRAVFAVGVWFLGSNEPDEDE